MSLLFVYICTNTTADPYLPPMTPNITTLARDVSDAFSAISGGRFEVGRLALYPAQKSVQNHILCDGKEVSKVSFPELYAYLGDSEGAAAAGNFKVPNYLTGLTAATTAATETINAGTVSTPTPTTPPPTYDAGRSDRTYGNVESGGRPADIP